MKGRSLRARLLLASAVAVFAVLALTGFGLVYLFERHVERRITSELNSYINQIAGRLSFDEDGTPQLASPLADPRFETIFGGLYWQIYNEHTKRTSRSRSLWDTRLKFSAGKAKLGQIQTLRTIGPQNTLVQMHERRLSFEVAKGRQTARIAVATDLRELKALTRSFASETAVALAILGLLLLAASWWQVSVGLAPLTRIKDALAAIASGKARRIGPGLPSEVTPLAGQINQLMAFQEASIQKARDHSADLAHGFKTPLTALKADARRLRLAGHTKIAQDIARTERTMRRQIERELARNRIRPGVAADTLEPASLADEIIATLKRTPDGEHINFDNAVPPGLMVRMYRDDFADVTGNLAENAARHAKRRVTISARRHKDGICFAVEDDGEGISKSLREAITMRGVSRDQTGSGSGLGLSIVADVLEACGSSLQLATSSLGGLKATFTIPAQTPDAAGAPHRAMRPADTSTA